MQREKYIDIAKGIGILLVVFGHVVRLLEFETLDKAVDVIYSFHMPLFLMISGFCLGLKPRVEGAQVAVGSAAKKIFIKLMVPYFVWSFIYMFIGGWLESAGRYRVVLTLRGIAPLWFLATLAMCEFFMVILRKATRNLKSNVHLCVFALTAVLCVVLGFAMQNIRDFYRLDGDVLGPVWYHIYVAVGRFFISFPVYIFGYIFAKLSVLKACGRALSGVIGVVLVAGVSVLALLSELKVNTHLFQLSNNWIFLCTALLGSAGVLMISFSLEKVLGFLSFLGKNSLAIMILHYTPFKTIKYSGYMAWAVWGNEVFVSIAATVLSVGFCALGIYLVKKKFFLYK